MIIGLILGWFFVGLAVACIFGVAVQVGTRSIPKENAAQFFMQV